MSHINLGTPSFTGGTRSRSAWQPLPYIYSGFTIHPYHLAITPPTSPLDSHSESSKAAAYRNRFSWSGVKGGKEKAGEKTNAYEIPLDIGDEFFAFEEYRIEDVEGGKGDVWYRGYVVQAVSLTSLQPISGRSTSATFPRLEPSVLIGIFPAACVHVRASSANDDGSLTAAYERAVHLAEERSKNAVISREMEAVKEEDEEGYDASSPSSKTPKAQRHDTGDVVTISATQRSPSGIKRDKRPKSLIIDKTAGEDTEQPPLPKLTAGDSTAAGQQWPLVDEIACAIREWYSRLPTYLANREYRLFSTVTQHIDALFLGRRQLLSQTLSGDELIRVRRECVSRLVKCNVAQGLEVIVRSLEDGSVMVVDRDRAFTGASWIDGITCYIYQIQLAYIDLIPLDALFGRRSTLMSLTRLPGSVQSSQRISLAAGPTKMNTQAPTVTTQPSYLHLLLDVRAFVASPCAPGETAELFFALYNKAESRFITEEFCLILNHLGSPARDPEQRLGRLRTLFTDLKREDLSGSIFLVCRIVRNGALKMRSESMAGTLDSQHRSGAVRSASTQFLSDYGSSRGGTSTIGDHLTDDSFSVTSGFGGHRTNTIDTQLTAPNSIVDGRPTFRRPLGCAVIELPQLQNMLHEAPGVPNGGVEATMPIWVPREESNFATLHEEIIHGRTQEFAAVSRSETIAISLTVFDGVASRTIHDHPSLLSDVPITSRLGFADVVDPNSFRNDLYIKLWSASFAAPQVIPGGSIRSRKSVIPSSQGDVQVTVELRRNDGQIIPDAIYAGGSGEPPMAQHHSLVFHHNERPTFGELLKVSLPARTPECHLFLAFRYRGKDRRNGHDQQELERPFGFACLPLFSSTSCVKDGSHELALYKLERNIQWPNPSLYLDTLSNHDGTSSDAIAVKGLIPLRDRMTLRSYLCSSIHTQNDTLRMLFGWQSVLPDVEKLSSTIQMLGFVSEEETVKFVPAIFDSLFGILVANFEEREDRLHDLVFQSLIRLLSIITDRRFPNFRSVLDTYISQQFNYPASSFHLLRSMKSVMSTPNTKDYRSFLKIWHLLFRFIIRARELDRARGIGLDATSAHIEADFQKQTRSILSEINNLMRSTEKSLIGTQTLALQHFADVVPYLSQVFKPLEIAEIIIAFADNLTYAKGSIAIHKLLLLLQVVKSTLDVAEARALLVPAIVRWVKPHLGRNEDGLYDTSETESASDARRIKWLECNRLAVTVIAWMINKLQEWCISPIAIEDKAFRAQEEDNLEYCLSLMPSLLQTYVELKSAKNLQVLARHSSNTGYKETPDVFPTSYPFSLVSRLPPPSMLEQHLSGDDGLSTSGIFNGSLAECTVVVCTLILASPKRNLSSWFKELLDIEGADATSTILQTIFDFAQSIVQYESFPRQWLTLGLMCLQAIVKVLDPIAKIMEREAFIPPVQRADEFDLRLWTKAFELLCELCASEELALEDQAPQRRRAEWIIAGDLRDQGADLLLRMWNAIGWPAESGRRQGKAESLRYGGYQTRFSGLAEQILALCLSSHDQMCETAVEILFSMIYAEYVLSGNFDTIEKEVFAKLEKLFTTKTATTSDPAMRAYFVAQLRAVFEMSPKIDASFHVKVGAFLDEVELFIDLLLALRDLPETNDWAEERAAAVCQLMLFVQRVGRSDLYIRFVHQLVNIHVANRDWLGAGLALRLHADVYNWTSQELVDEFRDGPMIFPAQSTFARKEAIYYHAIDYLAEAEAYELTLDLCRELTQQHQKMTFNVKKLSELYTHQANLWGKIGQSSRHKVDYFRVAYFGEVTPLNRGKEFIIRGQPWQRYADVCEQLQHKYPDATIHRSKVPPTQQQRDGTREILWVTSVVPEPDLSLPVFSENVAANVQDHWRNNACQVYSSNRPYTVDKEVDAVLTWIEKTVVTTREALPGILNRSEVISIRYDQIAPIETAIGEVGRASKNLRIMARPRGGVPVDVKHLGTAINGAVDSPVSGGVKLYRKTFLDPSYIQRHPQDALQIERLRVAIADYAKAIHDALLVLKAMGRDAAFYEALNSHYRRAFSEEIATLHPADSTADLAHPTPSVLPHLNGSSQMLHPGTRDSPRISISSETPSHPDADPSTSGYMLPPLRLGPTPTSSGPPSLSRQASVPTSAVSSPRNTVTSGSTGSVRGTSSPSKGPPSLGSRALSIVGSIGDRSSGVSIVSEGTVDGTSASGMAENGESVKMGRLKRFSSMVRRK